jgi:hypothetical protein
MMRTERLAGEVFARLEEIDRKIAEAVAAGRCRHCEGPLHQGNYQRKPRGGLVAAAGEAFTRRHSLCCGRRGCRKRALPPSLRFLGRRVYLEAVVVLASVMAQIVATTREAVEASGVPLRTLGRWGCWWREVFPRLPLWAELRSRFVPPPPDETELPRSLVACLGGDDRRPDDAGAVLANVEALLATARYLAPTTTGSVVEGSRFVTAALAQVGAR